MSGDPIFPKPLRQQMTAGDCRDASLLSAFATAVMDRASSLGRAGGGWSWPELWPDQQDRTALDAFLQSPGLGFGRILDGDRPAAAMPIEWIGEGEYPKWGLRASAGLLLLLTAANRVAEMTSSQGLWAEIYNACSTDLRTTLFSGRSAPRAHTYQSIEYAARTWGVRHHFDRGFEDPSDHTGTPHHWAHTIRLHAGITRYDLECQRPLLAQLTRRRRSAHAGEDETGGSVYREVFRALLDPADEHTFSHEFAALRRVLQRYVTGLVRSDQIGRFDRAAAQAALATNPWAAGQRDGGQLIDRLLERVADDGEIVSETLADLSTVVEDARLILDGAVRFRIQLDSTAVLHSAEGADEILVRVMPAFEVEGAAGEPYAEKLWLDGEPEDAQPWLDLPADGLGGAAVRLMLAMIDERGETRFTYEEEVELWDEGRAANWFDRDGRRLTNGGPTRSAQRWVLLDADTLPNPSPERWVAVGRSWRAWPWRGPWSTASARDAEGVTRIDLGGTFDRTIDDGLAWVHNCRIAVSPAWKWERSGIWQRAQEPVDVNVDLPAEVSPVAATVDGRPAAFAESIADRASETTRRYIVSGPTLASERPGRIKVCMTVTDASERRVQLRFTQDIRVVGGLLLADGDAPSSLDGNGTTLDLRAGTAWNLGLRLRIEPPPMNESDRARWSDDSGTAEDDPDSARREFVVLEGNAARARMNAAPPGRRAGPMPLPALAGYGAPLRIGRPFNEHPKYSGEKARLDLAASVIDSGFLRSIVASDDPPGYRVAVDPTLGARLPDGPDARHKLWVLTRDGTWHAAGDLRLESSSTDTPAAWWASSPESIPEVDSEADTEKGVAHVLSGDGWRLGAVWHSDWIEGVDAALASCQTDAEAASLWRWMRWAKLPVLEHLTRFRRHAESRPAAIVSTVLRDGVGCAGSTPMSLRIPGEGTLFWNEVVARLLEDWRPSRSEAEQFLAGFRGDSSMEYIADIAPELIEACPLTAKRLIDQWLAEVKPSERRRFILFLGIRVLPDIFMGIATNKRATLDNWLFSQLEETYETLAARVARHPIVNADSRYVRDVVRCAISTDRGWTDYANDEATASHARAFGCLQAMADGRQLTKFAILAHLLGYASPRG